MQRLELVRRARTAAQRLEISHLGDAHFDATDVTANAGGFDAVKTSALSDARNPKGLIR